MAVPFLLIDGYNLLHAAGLARPTYGPGDLERCRHRLLRLLVNHLSDRERQRAKVVFDAHDAPLDLPRKVRFEGLQVLFAAPGTDADSLIEELIARHSAPRQVVVVSSDRRIRKAARRRRAVSLGSLEFLAELLERTPADEREEPNTSAPDPKFGGELSAGELEQWLRFFGPLDEVFENEPAQHPPRAPESTPTTPAAKTPPLDSDDENDDPDSGGEDWLAVFGDIPEAAELAEAASDDDWFRRLQAEIRHLADREDED